MGFMKNVMRGLYKTAPAALATRMSLDQIANLRHTDKVTGRHGFTRWYEEQWGHLRDQPITLLEMGVKEGASLLTWHDYFPRAQIIGLDIEESCRQFEQDRIKIVIGSQAEPAIARQIAALAPGGFDIILDDAGHFSDHQIKSLELFFPLVKRGGYYAIEDLHASYDPNYRNGSPETIMEHLKRKIDELNLEGKMVWADKPPAETLAAQTPFAAAVEMMAFYRSTMIIRLRK